MSWPCDVLSSSVGLRLSAMLETPPQAAQAGRQAGSSLTGSAPQPNSAPPHSLSLCTAGPCFKAPWPTSLAPLCLSEGLCVVLPRPIKYTLKASLALCNIDDRTAPLLQFAQLGSAGERLHLMSQVIVSACQSADSLTAGDWAVH